MVFFLKRYLEWNERHIKNTKFFRSDEPIRVLLFKNSVMFGDFRIKRL